MNLLFLRGQVPQDRDPNEIIFNTLEECDDVWTQLAYALCKDGGSGEIWYWGGNRLKEWKPGFIERWIPSFNKTPNIDPDVIFCRGGFPEYHHVLKKYPKAFKIYYGAGRRFIPQDGFLDYDLILQDSEEQIKECQKRFPNIRATTYIKPAADNIFFPHDVNKRYDICFPANGSQESIKGHDFVFHTVPEKFKVLNLGNEPKRTRVPKRIDRKRVLKSQMAKEYSKCKVGIVCCYSKVDSCPRVIPEMLACGLPIVVLDGTRFLSEKYISPQSGILSNENQFWENVEYVLNNISQFDPRKHYEENLSLEIAAAHIKGLIEY